MTVITIGKVRPWQAAMTLLEVLVTVTLLAIIGAAVLSWVRSQAAASRAAGVRMESLRTIMAMVRLLDDDLVSAIADDKGIRFRLVDASTLTLTTLNSTPGDPAGLKEVSWTLTSKEHPIERTVAPVLEPEDRHARVVTNKISGGKFRLDTKTGSLFLDFPRQGFSDQDVSVPLWVER
jgi:prepilin-type N-terminal cleavage/methylation domain-containing protein